MITDINNPNLNIAEEIRVRGTVQGVGFRPTVYRLAKLGSLCGEVCNDGEGVLIRIVGTAEAVETFIDKLQKECPPLAKIEAIARSPLSHPPTYTDFTITQSISNQVKTSITPDAATCPECKAEIFDPFSRWYRYPFTNCTHCGPRLSIVRAIPYDRRNTSMANFTMCSDCTKEYADVTNRRFHAQPVACHICGPKAWLERADGKPIVSYMFSMLDDVDAVCTLLQRGEIIAIKGIGGIHLACDATNETAVQKLRERKHRYHKPFALMAKNLEIIDKYCFIDELEKKLLQSAAAPIVLLRLKDSREEISKPIAASVAPNIKSLGFMLPYTPLHHLILRRMERPIVLTSGNISDEPQCITNEVAKDKLSQIADYFLLHNREIVNRVDDSVVKVVRNRLQILRRARGYAPAPIRLPSGFEQAPPILAMGSELKNTFCLLREGEAILSQHLGDLENAAALTAYRETLELYLHLFEHKPDAIALDLHPEYLSTKLGKELGVERIYSIQHHHAHIAACMAENGIKLETKPILGIALDGLGYGEDSTLWGGEFLLADYRSYQRLATFKPVAMLGGEQAIYQPWRNTYAHLMAGFNWDELAVRYRELEIVNFLDRQPRSLLNQMLAKGINSPLASSAGRLFDAVAAALGICRDLASYEGQGAIELEALVDNISEETGYPFEIISAPIFYLEPRPMWQALLTDLQTGVCQSAIATRFHLGLAKAIASMVVRLQETHSFTQVALTGGVFQNQVLLEQVSQQLNVMDLTVLTHSLVPANDGGLSLGQVAIAAAKSIQKGIK
ncbi:carbamoyltransferase HypF [Planktothrix sp. FACHB-1355]|uniref:Carbamoyltransferase n=1 Tax=Aerosakkonema funiforme FACHB-1375 TaxID=2949571 RepID=A0A926VGY5_9CYAN|nr:MULTISPECIES: carbamoyltransferase HypF [Oscillatoriales]MBD2183538.1 carbamoyltransferase HypF [Aerosakkonema funiforme FACHB-1375]MBD3558433.1 carbamoyltransferase HypF [Planktothrix sp. FACHB-1355]